MMQPIGAAVVAFLFSVVAGPSTIAALRRLKFGQNVRSEGPASHQKKTGTPTMGGVLIVTGLTLGTLLFAGRTDGIPYVLFAIVGFGLIGFMDDLVSILVRRSLGLTARQKLVGQVLLGLVVAIYALGAPGLGPSIRVPFSGAEWLLTPWLFVLLVIGVMVATTNAVNLSDGLDGLAAGATAIAAIIYAVIGARLGLPHVTILAASVAGACLGFSWYNAHPAQVFMGDTGSLALGAALGSLAVLTKTQLLLPIIGGLFVLETLSVMIQVTYFRMTGGRRIFRMSPLHHHFEQVGWAETKVVVRFWILAAAFGLIGLLSLGTSAGS